MTTDVAVHEEVVTFADGLPGFESSHRFVLVASPSLDPFTLLQGMGPDAPSFVAIDPRQVEPSFAGEAALADRARLDAAPGAPLLWLALVSAHEHAPATVNLRAPIVINPASMRGIQIVPAESPYRLDHPLG
ncbi:MAG TPA: flagellar assembly protein FliW [Vicinamibacterales bacterium]|nr:flagellar assembly protein FliW [Vicinamibacterales bacterium]